jgi:hypothetical protein
VNRRLGPLPEPAGDWVTLDVAAARLQCRPSTLRDRARKGQLVGAVKAAGGWRPCLSCGGMFRAEPAKLRAGQGKFCSRSCANEAKRIPPAERFWAKVAKSDGPDGCWEWTAARTSKGYGNFTVGGAWIPAQRFALILAGAQLGEDDEVCHTCDNRGCVRNDETGTYTVKGVVRPRWGHLFVGTSADNNRDTVAKGRHGWTASPDSLRKGSLARGARLTEDLVSELRIRFAKDPRGQAVVARELGIHPSTLGHALHGRRWRHVV